jgi:iron(III) transport system substrate-binding protein
VVYTSQDEVYASPVLQEFTKETGIATRVVYDSEAIKTVGLVNRLMAERNHPACDLFWNNEEFRTRLMAAKGMFDRTNGWALLGYRTRRMVVNTNFVSLERLPRSLDDLTNSFWRGHVALAYPMFGTTATYFLVLRQVWGEARWKTWCENLAANKPFLVDGNSVVVKFVGDGQAWVGLTDSDDIRNAQKDGVKVSALPLSPQSLLIHNTVGLIDRAPHPAEARLLMEYLKSPEVARVLTAADALEGTVEGADVQATLRVNWDSLLRNVDAGTTALQSIYLRNP